MRPVPLPQTRNRLRPGTQCTVAGWGLTGLNTRTDTLQCVQLRVQRDRVCSRRFMLYNGRTQICVGDPRQRKSAFQVRSRHLPTLTGDPGQTGQWDGPRSHGYSPGPRSEGCEGALFPIHPVSGALGEVPDTQNVYVQCFPELVSHLSKSSNLIRGCGNPQFTTCQSEVQVAWD